MKLYSFWRSSASYRVRIALALKGIAYEYVPVKLALDDSETQQDAFSSLNPQRLVPTLVDGDVVVSQSLAIFDLLERRQPEPPLFPRDVAGRARVMSLCLYVACEIQPLQNLRTERYLRDALGADDEERACFRGHFQAIGFDAVERLLSDGHTGTFAHGDSPGAADCFIAAQVPPVRRSGYDLARWPTIARITAACEAHPAFVAASPERQPDAP